MHRCILAAFLLFAAGLFTETFGQSSAPQISAVAPTTARAGDQIVINGSNFGSSQGTGNVWLGSTYGVVVSWSDSQVVAVVASGSQSGVAQILQGGVWSNPVNFTVITPNIASVTPTTAIAGTQITITGTGFGASQSSGNVWLGSTYGVVVSWSDTQVVANVASGSKSGVAQILQGGVWSNTVNLTVSTPNITSVTPTTAIAGTQITVTGTGFGASQGSGNVWLGSTYGVVVSWSDTQVIANVASGSSSGVAQVLQGGVWSNTVSFTVITPNITSVSPASGSAGTQVTIAGTGFGATQGSGNVWLGSTYGVVVSWSDTQVVATVASGSNTGVAQILQGGVWSNPVTFTIGGVPPVISSISPNTGGIGTAVTITGSSFGNTQGQSTVTFNGIPARILGWSDTTISASVPAGLSPGTVTVVVNGNSVASNGVSFTVTNPLYVHLSNTTMTVGQTRPIQLLDENGAVISNPSWTFDNSSIAEIVHPVNPGDPILLQADSVGTTTLVASSGDRTGTATVTVLASGTPPPVGTVLWSLPSLGGGTISKTVQSLRVDDNTPDLYAEDDGALGGYGAIRGLTADGQQKWIWPSTASSSNPVPILLAGDDQGGAIYLAITNNNNQFGGPGYIGRVDENGNESWQYQWGGRFNDQPNPQYAIHPDGTIYLVDDNYQGTFTSYVVGLDPATGLTKFAVPLPSLSQQTQLNYTQDFAHAVLICTPGSSSIQPLPTAHGSLAISSDGTAYLPIYSKIEVLDGEPCDGSPQGILAGHQILPVLASWSLNTTLWLMTIQPDGTFSMQALDTTSDSGTDWDTAFVSSPLSEDGGQNAVGTAIPDGQGGALFPGLHTLYHLTSLGISRFSLPITVTQQTFGNDGQDPLLLGEDGTAYIAGTDSTGNDSLIAVDSSGTLKWTASSPGKSPRLSTVTADGSVVFQSMQADNAMHVSIADPKGNVAPLFASPTDGSDIGPAVPNPFYFAPALFQLNDVAYWTLGTWDVPDSTGGLDAIVGGNVLTAASERPEERGNRKRDNKPAYPKVANYLPSQIEADPAGNPTTATFPCFQDVTGESHLKNALNRCANSPAPAGPTRVTQEYRLRTSAIAQTFQADLKGQDWQAIAYFGHSSLANFEQPNQFSKGITFYYPAISNNPNKLPGDESSWDIGYSVPGVLGLDILGHECAVPNNFCVQPPSDNYLNALLPFEKDATTVTALSSAWAYRNHGATLAIEPGPPHAPILLVNKISQQAKILFFGACALAPPSAQPTETPVFIQMWDINDARYGTAETRDRAMIVPDSSSIANFNTDTTDLVYAAFMWSKIVFDLVKMKMNVFDAVQDANNTITPQWPTVPGGSVQPKFMVLGNPKVKLK